MKKILMLPAVAAAALALSTFAPAQAAVVSPTSMAPASAQAGDKLVEEVRFRGRRGRRFGVGAGIVTLGVLGAIAASRAHSRPYYHSRPHYYRDGYDGQCRRWRRWCRRGNDRACWRYDTRC